MKLKKAIKKSRTCTCFCDSGIFVLGENVTPKDYDVYHFEAVDSLTQKQRRMLLAEAESTIESAQEVISRIIGGVEDEEEDI